MANMTKEMYFNSLRKVSEDIVNLAEVKGSQYWDNDPFQAFRELEEMTGVPKEGALMLLASKHWGALCKVAMGSRTENPALTQERIKDVILYLLILHQMKNQNTRENEEWKQD